MDLALLAPSDYDDQAAVAPHDLLLTGADTYPVGQLYGAGTPT